MKNFTLLIFGLLLASSLAFAQSATPLAANGQLKVLSNQAGKAPTL